MSHLEIIAQQDNDRYLLVPKDKADPITGEARILDVGRKRLSKKMYLQTILAQGDWDRYTGSQGTLDGWLKEVGDDGTG